MTEKATVLQAVVEMLAADVSNLEHEVVVYRELAQVTLAQNAELMKQHVALRQQISDRRDEIRRYIESQVMPV
jgi:cell division protein FtsB